MGKSIETESSLWLPQIWGEGEWGATVSGDENNGCMTMQIYSVPLNWKLEHG